MQRPPLTLLCLLLLAVAGCGAGKADSASRPPPKPAATPQEFVERFASITGLRLEPVPGDTFGTRLDEPQEPDRFLRLGTFSLVWSGNDHLRETLLGRNVEPDAEGIYWERVGDGWSAAKAFGPRLVMQWTGEETKKTTPKRDRLERAVRAAYLGQTDLLPEAERPCEERGLEPLDGEAGECSVDGIPVTFAEAAEPLRLPALEARVLGVETSEVIGEDSGVPARAEGRFVEVAYRVRNTGDRPIRFLRMALRIGDRSYEPAAGAGVLLPRSRELPIPPGESFETSVAFDVDRNLSDRARAEGALVVPAAVDELGDPAPDLAQGWIRLAKAPARLPEPPEPERPPGAPPLPPEPEGPPDIETDTGSGAPIGGTARRLYMANTYFPVPDEFVPGGVRIGSKAGGCEVPRPTRRDRGGLLAAARGATPAGRVRRPLVRELLLADCGDDGRWAILFWTVRRPGRSLTIAGDELVLRRGRWVGTPEGVDPGCRLPEAAAAVWQIDISICG